jgi:hypothetical protein
MFDQNLVQMLAQMLACWQQPQLDQMAIVVDRYRSADQMRFRTQAWTLVQSPRHRMQAYQMHFHLPQLMVGQKVKASDQVLRMRRRLKWSVPGSMAAQMPRCSGQGSQTGQTRVGQSLALMAVQMLILVALMLTRMHCPWLVQKDSSWDLLVQTPPSRYQVC